jgi:hypothetical protein
MPRRGSRPSSSVRRVLTTRGGFGERFVASWNELVELVEDDAMMMHREEARALVQIPDGHHGPRAHLLHHEAMTI